MFVVCELPKSKVHVCVSAIHYDYTYSCIICSVCWSVGGMSVQWTWSRTREKKKWENNVIVYTNIVVVLTFVSHRSLLFAPQNLCSFWHLLCQWCGCAYVFVCLCEFVLSNIPIACLWLRLCICLFIIDVYSRRRSQRVDNCSIAWLVLIVKITREPEKTKTQQQGVQQQQQRIYMQIVDE